ncbi:MAG: hypothetical protein Q4D04_01410 [Clostridia bacterium]|nr:hypothetical protein [Clostridia bacterium]
MSLNKPSTRRIAAAAISLAVILLSRIPALYVNPVCAFAAKLALAFCLFTICDCSPIVYAAAYCVVAPFVAWWVDIVEGQMAVAYGLAAMAFVASNKYIKTEKEFKWIKPAISAVSAAVVIAAYSAVLLSVRQERTFFSALWYSMSRQAIACVAIFIGAYIGSLRPGISKSVSNKQKSTRI